MDVPYCEVCGETHASLKTAECAVCDDCFAQEIRAALRPVIGWQVCGFPIRQRESGEFAACLAIYGIEHAH